MGPTPLAHYAKTKDAEAFAQVVTQYQSLVFATCRRQLRNPADVDDAVQETFLRLAQKASELHSNVGAWLHTCAMNVSIDMNRRRKSRIRYESAAASPQVTSDDSGRAMAELREHLDSALEKLSPAERELIIERFFCGTSQIDLAAKAGVAPSTLSHRLDRAIEALRQHLKAAGCLAATAGGAAGLLDALHAEHASAAVPQALTANLMKIGLTGVGAASTVSIAGLLLALATILVIAICCWIVCKELSATAYTMAPSLPQKGPASQPIPALNVDAPKIGATLPPDWKTAHSNTPSAVLAGRVVDQQGKPVSGARVVLSGTGGMRSITNADGYYSFHSLPRGDGNYNVTVRADGYLPIDPNPIEEPALQLSGSSEARRDFVLHRGAMVDLQITDTLNQPLPRVQIDVTKLGERLRGRLSLLIPGAVDGRGHAKFTIPAGQGACCIVASLRGYAPQRAIINPTSAGLLLPVHIVMQPGLFVRGVAICSDHKPAAGCTISAQPDWWNSNWINQQENIDSSGHFTLTTVGPGNYSLYVWDQNRGQDVAEIHLPPATQPIRLNLPFPSPASLATATGRIHIHGAIPSDVPFRWLSASGISNMDDGPSANLDVELGSPDQNQLWRFAHEGTYTINAPPGTYRIVFNSPYIKPLTLESVRLPGDLPTVTVEMANQPNLTGTVTDAATDQPVTHFAVRVRKVDPQGGYVQDDQWTQVSDPNGHFDIVCIDWGTYSAQVSAPGYAWQWSPPVSLDAEHSVRNIRLRLNSGGSLTGTVVNPSGNPVAGAKVIPLSMAMGLQMGQTTKFETEAGVVLTDHDGHFRLPHLQGGDETLKISYPDYSPLIVPDLKVVEGKPVTVPTIALHQGGSIDGIIYDSLGHPLSNVALHLQDSPNNVRLRDTTGRIASVITDKAGHYHLDHLPTQVIWVELENPWERQGVVRRVIRPLDGKTARLDFGGPNLVRGRLLDAGKPVPNCNLRLAAGSRFNGDIVALTSTDSSGNFAFYGPPPGRYTLYAESLESGERDRYLRDLEVADHPLDLGDVEYDCGDVIIKMAFEDPAIASSRKWIRIAERFPTYIGQRFGARPVDNGDHLLAVGVPAGHFVVLADIDELPGMTFAAPFEQPKKLSQTTVVFHIPKLTARLKLIDTSPAMESANPRVLEVQNEEGTVQVLVGPGNPGRPLPPGVYRVLDLLSGQPRADSPRIILTAGATTVVKADISRLRTTGDVGAAVSVWSADGILDTSSTVRLLNESGIEIKPAGIEDFSTVFVAPPGQYRAEINRSDRSPVLRDVDLPPSSSPGPLQRVVPVYLVLP